MHIDYGLSDSALERIPDSGVAKVGEYRKLPEGKCKRRSGGEFAVL